MSEHSLQIIYGAAGCGKTFEVRRRMCELAEAGGRPVLIVPEQFSFESERAMLEMLGARAARYVKIYSFTRLAEEVSRICRAAAGRRIDDCGRVAAMGEALASVEDRLDFYKGKQTSAVFIDHLLDAAKEFKLCAVTADMLARSAENAQGTLRRKLKDLSLVYGAYEAVVASAALDPMDDLTLLYKQLGENGFFDGSTVFIDAFRGFTGQEMRVIERIMCQAECCVVTVCAETSEVSDKDGLFAPSYKTAAQLRSAAKEHGVAIKAPVILGVRRRFASPELEAIENGIFRYRPEEEATESVFSQPTDNVVIYEADSRYGEMEFCARECRRLIREEGFRCRDIAIIARAEGTYCDLAYDALTLQEIPCYLDRRTDAASCALMQFVLSALDVVCRGWQSDDILRWLKTGLVSGVSLTDAAELENYAFVWRLKGRRWSSEFRDNPSGLMEMSDSDREQLERINAVRARAMELLNGFASALENASGEDMAAAVFEFVEKSGVPEQLRMLCGRLDESFAREQSQLWDSLMAILDQIALITGKRRISKDRFAAYVSLMINRCDIGHIPHGLDDVVFGGADRMRVAAPRAVFIVGALDGEFPASPSGSGVFTDDERRQLHDELSLPVAETLENQMLEERLMAYSAICAASERLYITYPLLGGGEKAHRSECVDEIFRCVTRPVIRRAPSRLSICDIEAPAAAFELSARYWQSGGAADALAYVLTENVEYAPRLRAVGNAVSGDLTQLSENAAAELFGSNTVISASRAETFFNCRFRYFCQYGLNVSPRRRAELDSMQYGQTAHFVLENIFSAGMENVPYQSYPDAFRSRLASLTSDPEKVGRMVGDLIEKYLEDKMGGEKDKPASFLYTLRTMQRSLTFLVLSIASELSCSDFLPEAYELPITPEGGRNSVTASKIKLKNGGTLSVRGAVDRVDCWHSADGKNYLRVIDYKTGTKSFKIGDLLDGLNMQMLIYLDELCRDGSGRFGGSVPAGILYCPAYSGTVKTDRSISDEKLSDARGSEIRRKGFVIDGSEDYFVCSAMENGMAGKYVPFSLTKNGVPSKNAHHVTPGEYKIISSFVRFKLREMCGELAAGRVSPDPLKASQYNPCLRCDYYAACRYSGAFRNKTAVGDDQQIYSYMMQTIKEEGGDE